MKSIVKRIQDKAGNMGASIQLQQQAGVAQVTLSHPGRFNAMSSAMWQALRTVFEDLGRDPDLRCVVVAGAGGSFCAGGDISEYAAFRFQEATLRDFHENLVWPALQAMLDCDVPVVAQIEGACMGAGVEIACCCDVRLAGSSARFGAPIARLGFPMAPLEAALLVRELGLSTVRRMLLEAALFSATELQAGGFLGAVLPDDDVAFQAQDRAARMAALAPQAARLNKRTLRALMGPLAPIGRAQDAMDSLAKMLRQAYAYADSAEHREGIAAFMEKRRPVF